MDNRSFPLSAGLYVLVSPSRGNLYSLVPQLCSIWDVVSLHTSHWVFLLIPDVLCIPKNASPAPCKAVVRCSLSVDELCGCRCFGRRFFSLSSDILRTSGCLWGVNSCQEPPESNSACPVINQIIQVLGLSLWVGLGWGFSWFCLAAPISSFPSGFLPAAWSGYSLGICNCMWLSLGFFCTLFCICGS